MPLHVSSACTHHQEVKIALHSLWYHHTYRCDYTTGCVMQFWPPDNEHMCSKHVEAWNKLIVKQKILCTSWLITEINILSEISDAASLFRCFPHSHVATPSSWARRGVGWGLVSRPRYVACNAPVMHSPHSTRLQTVTNVQCAYWSNTAIFE